MSANNQQIEVGDKVARVFAWGADEIPTDANFRIGEVLEIVNDGRYLKISGLDGLAPLDRVHLIEKGNVRAFPKFVYLDEKRAAEILKHAESKGFRASIVAVNFDRDQFEVVTDSGSHKDDTENRSHKVRLRFSDSSDACFANCDCLDFKVRNRICKHIAFIAINEVFAVFETRAAA